LQEIPASTAEDKMISLTRKEMSFELERIWKNTYSGFKIAISKKRSRKRKKTSQLQMAILTGTIRRVK
jgi:hypothetical protein